MSDISTADVTALSVRWPWIASSRFDLLWLNASALAGFLYLGLIFQLKLPSVLVFAIWTCLFDRPHFISTYVRTYMDRQERAEKGRLLLGSLAWLLLGPAILLFSAIVNSLLPWSLYFAFALVYGWWHILRQNYGFLVQYQIRGREPFGVSNRSEFYLFHIALVAPLFAVVLKSRILKEGMGLAAVPLAISKHVGEVAALVASLAMVLLIVRALLPCLKGQVVNVAKAAFIFSCTALPLFLCYSDYARNIDYFTLVGVVTVSHNIQYMAYVWYYSQGKYQNSDPVTAGKAFGLAFFCTRNLLYFLAAIVCLGFGLRLFEFWLTGDPSLSYFVPENFVHSFSQVRLWRGIAVEDVTIGVAVGIPLHHYYLDSKIWRVRT